MKQLHINIENKTYADQATMVLQDLDMQVAAGEFVSIVGPSGAGKTTLLNIVSGLDDLYDGVISFSSSEATTRDTKVGYVFQEPRLMPWLTIGENLQLVLQPAQFERIPIILEQVGLAEAINQYPKALSGGMLRRVALARAFVTQPDVLLLDEPFISVDAPTADRLRDLLLTLWSDYQPTVIMVTHVLREALALADRVLFLSVNPATVVFEHKISLERPRHLDDEAVITLHRMLLRQHPDILSGIIVKNEEEQS